jgi:MerR family transcriptional regulator, light-induced transcriptional regulator
MLLQGEGEAMTTAQASFDEEVFTRTASLFAAKRDVFAPGAIEALAQDIMRRMATILPREAVFETLDIDPDQIAAFCEALVQPEAEAALRFIADRRAEGVTRQGVYLGYITAAARHLGDSWDTDRLTFAQVTYGTGHLYALMRALRAERPTNAPALDGKRCALFATVPGEDHGMGITIAADMFRDLGWEIDLRTDTDHDALITHVDRTRPQIIGLSLSGERRLDALVRMVVAMRIIVPQAVIGVAPGPSVDTDRLHALVDIDLVFRDTRTAFQDLDRLIRLRG